MCDSISAMKGERRTSGMLPHSKRSENSRSFEKSHAVETASRYTGFADTIDLAAHRNRIADIFEQIRAHHEIEEFVDVGRGRCAAIGDDPGIGRKTLDIFGVNRVVAAPRHVGTEVDDVDCPIERLIPSADIEDTGVGGTFAHPRQVRAQDHSRLQ